VSAVVCLVMVLGCGVGDFGCCLMGCFYLNEWSCDELLFFFVV